MPSCYLQSYAVLVLRLPCCGLSPYDHMTKSSASMTTSFEEVVVVVWLLILSLGFMWVGENLKELSLRCSGGKSQYYTFCLLPLPLLPSCPSTKEASFKIELFLKSLLNVFFFSRSNVIIFCMSCNIPVFLCAHSKKINFSSTTLLLNTYFRK